MKPAYARTGTPALRGALIFLEKLGKARQMMRVRERVGMYDRTKLDMGALVGTAASDFDRSEGAKALGTTASES